jgi:uncharacterized protein
VSTRNAWPQPRGATDIGRQRERAGEIDDHGDWAASEATRLLDAGAVPAEQGSSIEGDR